MADISARITRKSLKAKRKAAIKTLKAQTKEKINEIKIQYATNPERLQAKSAEREQRRALRVQRQNARLAYNARQPRQYTLGEALVNSISHGIGAGLSVAAIVLLVVRAYHAPADRLVYMASFSLFGASLFVLYMMSTLYHAITPYGARKVFSIFNHIAIYLLIAGTYTPFVLTRVQGNMEWILTSLIWGACLALSALYAVFGARLRGFSVFTYVVLGWLLIVVLGCINPASKLPSISRLFIILGGITYTVGGVFFLMRRYKWTHSIFQLLVLAGSILHFFGVYYSI